MGLQAQPTGAAGGSGQEITSMAATGPPALSTLDDVTSQPTEAGHSAGTAAEGGETVTASLTAEQQGDATCAAFEKDSRVNRAAALKASDEARRAARSLRSGGAAPEEGEEERAGLGVGYGVFDAVYKPPAGEPPAARYGRNYADKSRWTAEVAQDWEARLEGLRAQWGLMNVTVRLFKVSWQG